MPGALILLGLAVSFAALGCVGLQGFLRRVIS